MLKSPWDASAAGPDSRYLLVLFVKYFRIVASLLGADDQRPCGIFRASYFSKDLYPIIYSWP